jgi:putative membrane-bound dehydrogenase-like protein
MKPREIPVLLSILAAVPLAAEEEVIPHRQDHPPNRPHAPAEAVALMTVPEGFSVELVAHEPDISNPIAMAFDDRGRIWITESVEYPRKAPGPGRDRVKVLEDSDGDGRADRFTVFADGLNIPTGIAVGHGGVWVLNAPDLLFFPAAGDRAERREVVVTGFGRADTHELPSSLTWGPDGWLYGLNGVFNPSRVASGGKVHEFTCAMYRVHPRTREFRVVCEGTSNPWGIAWDLDGSAIVSACHWANDHLFHFVETGYYKRQAGPYPPYSVRLGSITTHSHQKTAYCGLAFLDSDAYPEPYRERFYLGNIHGNAINADVLRRDGSTYVSSAEPDLLAANDAWFMPVAQKVGPDGCLYVLDWYDRYHCYQDANRDPAGIDRGKGRLYRIRHERSPRPPRFDLASEADGALIERLGSPNIFFREAAQRVLAERARPGARGRLEALVLGESTPRKQRLHALWALIGMGPLPGDLHRRLLAHPDAAVRAWGVRAAGDMRAVAPEVRAAVEAAARDAAPEVRLQAAIAARKVEGIDPLAVLVRILEASGEDKLIPPIVWQNLHPLLETEGMRFARLAEEADLRRRARDSHRHVPQASAPALTAMLPRAVDRLLGARAIDADAVALVADLAARSSPAAARDAFSAVSGRWEGIEEASRAALRSRLEPVLARVLESAGDDSKTSAILLAARLGVGGGDAGAVRARFLSSGLPAAARVEALEALVAFRDPELLDLGARVLAGAPPALAAPILRALARADDPRLADRILAAYGSLHPEAQPLAIDLLLEREPWTRRLLDAVKEKRLPPSALHANHLRKVLEMNERESIWLVERTWGRVREERSPEQERVAAEMGALLRRTPGDPAAGEAVFKRLCGQCHAIHGEGKSVGPDLTANGRASFDQLLSNVFDPSLVIGAGYQAVTVVTADGRNVTGIPIEDGEERIVLRLAGGEEEAVPRRDVKYARASKLSMMPEGIEKLFSEKELADLFAFLAFDRHPGDPAARPIPGAPGWVEPPAGGR